LFDDPKDDELLFDDELFDDELLFEEVFAEFMPIEELLLLLLLLLLAVELLLLMLIPLPLVSFLAEEPVLVVLYSLSELLPPLLDQPELADSSDDDVARPLPDPLLIETTFTCVSRRASMPSSDESLLKLIPLEFKPVLPGGRDRLALRLAGLILELLAFDLIWFSCFSSMTLNPCPLLRRPIAELLEFLPKNPMLSGTA